MSFSSYSFFLLFLPIVLVVFYFLMRTSSRKPALIFLVLASFLFYIVATPWYVLLLGASLACNYWLKLRIQSSRWHGKTWLVAGIVVNCLVLATFKYLDFFIGNLNHVLNSGKRPSYSLRFRPNRLILSLPGRWTALGRR